MEKTFKAFLAEGPSRVTNTRYRLNWGHVYQNLLKGLVQNLGFLVKKWVQRGKGWLCSVPRIITKRTVRTASKER